MLDIVIILDESYSMTRYKNDYIIGINNIILSQKSIDPNISLTLLKFSDTVNVLCHNERIGDLPLFTPKHYDPRGQTALHDAIGQGIKFKQDCENVVMIIITDGYENSSKNFNQSEIKKQIKYLYSCSWEFVYIATNQNAIEKGGELGIKTCITYGESDSSIKKAMDICNIAIGKASYKWFGKINKYVHQEIQNDVRDIVFSLGKFKI